MREVRGVDNVTTNEGIAPRRVSSSRVAGFKGSFIYPIGWTKRVRSQMSLGFDLKLEGDNHFLEVGVGFTVPAGATSDLAYGGLWSDIGASFYLTHDVSAPYIGFGILPRLMSSDVTNLAGYVQGGMMFFRDVSTRLYVDARVAQNVLPVGFQSCPYAYDSTVSPGCSTQRLYPTEISLNVGIGF